MEFLLSYLTVWRRMTRQERQTDQNFLIMSSTSIVKKLLIIIGHAIKPIGIPVVGIVLKSGDMTMKYLLP